MLRRVLVLLPLLLAACGDDDGDVSASTTTEAPATTEAPSDETTTTAPVEETTAPTNSDPRPDVEVIELEVVGGQPVGGAAEASVPLGANVSIQVTADVEDEIHLHGYDLTAEVAPGQLGEITFVAEIPGQFEIELEGSGVLIANLTVS